MRFRDYRRDLSFLPGEFQTLLDALIRLEDESGVIADLSIQLPADEVKICLNFIKENKEKSQDLIKILLSKIKTTEPLIENLYLIRDCFVAYQLKNNDALIKSTRFDSNCFIYAFSEGITPVPSKPIVKKPLRRGEHLGYTVYAAGVFERAKGKKPTPYKLSPEEIAKRKSELSAHQSTSLVTPTLQSPVFGHDRSRKNVLVGFIVEAKRSLINRMYVYDGGTLDRPYEFRTAQEAERYHKHVTANPRGQILFDDLDKFKEQLEKVQHRGDYNEVMGRIQWTRVSSTVSIFNDNYPSRCGAQFNARVEKRYLKEQVLAEGLPWDESYRLPITYYVPGETKHWDSYTHEEQMKDELAAQSTLADPGKFAKAIKDNETQFLLLINPRVWLANDMAVKYIKGEIEPKIQPQLRYALLWRYVLEENPKVIDPKLTGNFLDEDDAEYFLIHGGDLKVFEFAIKNKLFEKDIRWELFLTKAIEKNRLSEIVLILQHHKTLHINLVEMAKNNLPVDMFRQILPQLKDKAELLAYAITHSMPRLVEAFIEQEDFPELVKMWTSVGETPLTWAVKARNLVIVRKLLAHPDRVVGLENAKDSDGKTALMLAAEIPGEIGDEISKALLSSPHVDPNVTGLNDDTYVSLLIKKYITGQPLPSQLDNVLSRLNKPASQIDFSKLLEFIFNYRSVASYKFDINYKRLDDLAVRILQVDPDLLSGDHLQANRIFVDACMRCDVPRTAFLALSHPDFDPSLLNLKRISIKNVMTMAILYNNVDLVLAVAAKLGCPSLGLGLDFYKALNSTSENALCEYAISAIRYLEKLDARQEAYQPRFIPNFLPTIHWEKIGLAGYSKDQKKSAVMRFLNSLILENETPEHPFVKPEDLPVLQNGKFYSEIYNKLPAKLKQKIETHAAAASVKLKK